MITTLLKLMSCNENVFRNCKHKEADELCKLYFAELEKCKRLFKEEDKENVSHLLLAYHDYLTHLNLIETDNFVILALKIGIELGRYFDVLEDL